MPVQMFEEGERVMARQKDVFYEAKVTCCHACASTVPTTQVLKIEMRAVEGKKAKEAFYFVHYQGWNDRLLCSLRCVHGADTRWC